MASLVGIVLLIRRMNMQKVLLLIFLLSITNSTLEVYMPNCARQMIPQPIQYTLSSFGKIPYGVTILGKIQTTQPDIYCQVPQQTRTLTEQKRIFLIKRGDCKFTKKIIQAENSGADLVLIYDNQTSKNPTVLMSDDGHGHLISIPSMFISNTDGQLLVKALKQCGNQLYLRAYFQVFQSEIANLTLLLDIPNRESYILLRDFVENGYYKAVESTINFSTMFKVSRHWCPKKVCKEDDCIGNPEGLRYCYDFPHKENSMNISHVNGKMILLEEMRAYYLLKILGKDNQQIWWNYMIKFDDEECLESPGVDECSFSAMDKVGVNIRQINQVRKIVDQQIYLISKGQKDNILQKFHDYSKQMGIMIFPQATINNKNFFGLFRAPDVFDMLCQSLTNLPSQCFDAKKKKIEKQEQKDETGDVWKVVLIIVGIITIVFILSLVIYTKVMRKEVNQNLSMEVNKMVENYVQLAESRETSHSRDAV